jgi:cytochrome c biogenesis protein
MVKKTSRPLWDFLSSVRLTVVLLILVAITSIFGTIIPQEQAAATRFARDLSPGLLNLFNSLQLFDMYHSLWFRSIICLLASNLIVCSLNRFPATLKLFRLTPKPDRSKPFEGIPPQRVLTIECGLKEATDNVRDFLKERYKTMVIKETDKETYFHCEKGRFTIFGVYLVHLSVLIILMGGIIGSLLGFNGYVNILEGGSTDTVFLREGMSYNEKDLGFGIHCENFSIDFYDNGMPKEYRSDLEFIMDGMTVREAILLVNHPIKFKGITFYQASYGSLAGDKALLRVSNSEIDMHDSTLEVELGKPVPLPGNGAMLILADISDDFMNMGPAVKISVMSEEGEETSFWLFKNQDDIKKQYPGIFDSFPRLNPSSYKPYTFYVDDIETVYYTGLQVNKDPGIPLVYTGFFTIIIGLFVTFLTSHKRIWVHITGKPGKISVKVAGKASKNQVGMEKELDRLVTSLDSCLNPGRET